MVRVAFYGKGGIGKSTTSSNISYSLASRGLRVIQIGCDPKSDSTRSLQGGKHPTTVLEYVRKTAPSSRKLDDVLVKGSAGVMCIEAGGPEPGIGCAGRGILTTFDTLDKLGVWGLEADHTIYDVLGDVVCGGFAVPLRRYYTDAIFIVTSGEFMSIYAANNIMRGILNFNTEVPRVAGLIFNRRGDVNEEDIIQRFSGSTGIPIVADIPRDESFKEAEGRCMTVSELFPDSEPSRQYQHLAELIVSIENGITPLYNPHPLDDEQLNNLVSGTRNVGTGRFTRNRSYECDSMAGIRSCASRGAVFAAGRVIDLPIIVHGPPSCGYVMSHTQDIHYLEDIATNPALIPRMRNNITCTGMDMGSTVFGGGELLRQAVIDAADSGSPVIAVVTTCVPGMIGDDVDEASASVMSEHPGLEVMVVRADGNLSGDSEEGRLQVIEGLVGLIDPSVEPCCDRINIVDDTFMWFRRGMNESWTRRLLESMGLEIGTMLFEDCSIDDIRRCRRNKFTFMVDDSPMNLHMAEMLEGRGIAVEDCPLPKGYRETMEWVTHVSGLLGIDSSGILESIEEDYKAALNRFRPFIEGKRIIMFMSMSFPVDWVIECLRDAGALIDKVYVFRIGPGSIGFHTRFQDEIEFVWDLAVSQIDEEVRSHRPDLVVGTSNLVSRQSTRSVSIPQNMLTHRASIAMLERVSAMLTVPPVSGWKSWRVDIESRA